MVQTPTKPNTLNLQDLEKLLQKRLYSEPLQLVPLQIRCVLKEEILTILIQHPDPALPHPRMVFRILRQMLEDEEITLNYEVLIYLRVHGQKRPYSFHSLKIQSDPDHNLFSVTENSNENLINNDLNNPLNNHESNKETEEFNFNKPVNHGQDRILNPDSSEDNFDLFLDKKQIFIPNNDNSEDSLFEGAPLVKEDLIKEEEDLFPDFGETDPELEYNSDLEPNEFEDEPEFYSSDDSNLAPEPKPWRKGLILGLTTSLALFFGTFYLLTRPCVISQCDAMTEAQQYANTSNQILKQNPSGRAIFEAQKQLQEAISLLEQIPRWSVHHSKAELFLTRYQDKAQTLDNLITALKTASQASTKTQKPPYTVEKWQEVQQDWRSAIARLETIKSDSELYLLAQAKMVEYRNNLNAINGRLNEEAKALEKLKIAQETIKVAQVRQGTAQSLDNWQLVYATWQTAIERLKEIPPSTTVYEKAQKLMNDYSNQIAEVRDKKNKELFAVNAYNQALRLAQLAKNAEMVKQWSASVYHWRNALNYIQQVPQNSFQYNQVQPLLTAYQGALIQAENQLRKTLKLQQAKEDLAQTCKGVTKVCDFTVSDSLIKVKLTPNYIEDIRQTALKAKAQANTNTQIALLDHISTVEQALQIISNNTGLRVEVYEPNNSLAIAYMPKQ